MATSFIFREIQARCRDLTVNQWLGEFDSHTRSQIWGEPRAAALLCKHRDYKGSIPWSSTKYNATLADVVIAAV